MQHVINSLDDVTLDLYEDVTRHGGTVELSSDLAKRIDDQLSLIHISEPTRH